MGGSTQDRNVQSQALTADLDEGVCKLYENPNKLELEKIPMSYTCPTMGPMAAANLSFKAKKVLYLKVAPERFSLQQALEFL